MNHQNAIGAQHLQLKENFRRADFIQAWDDINDLKDFKLQGSRMPA